MICRLYRSPLTKKMEEKAADFLTKLYNSPQRNVFALSVTGGGTSAISWLFSVPGASRSVMQATVPYAFSALSR